MFVPRLLLSALLLVAPPASAARLSGLPSLASARDRAGAALLRAVDRDRDGEVSLEDLERCVASIGRPVAGGARAAAALWSRHSDECLAAAGAAGLLYGGPFAYSVLFVRAFTGVGWAAVRGVLSRLREAYHRAKELPPRETEARAARAAALRSELRSLASECEATERVLSLSAHRGGRAAPRSARTTAAEARRAALLGRMRDVRCELDALPPSRRAAPVLAAAAAHEP